MYPLQMLAKCPLANCPLTKCLLAKRPLAKCPLAICPGFEWSHTFVLFAKMLHFPQGEYRGDSLFPPQIKSLYHIIENCSPGSVTTTKNGGTLWIIPPRIPANETGMTDTKGIKLKNLLFGLLQIPPPPTPSDFLCTWEWRASKYFIKGQELVHRKSIKGHLKLIKGLCI